MLYYRLYSIQFCLLTIFCIGAMEHQGDSSDSEHSDISTYGDDSALGSSLRSSPTGVVVHASTYSVDDDPFIKKMMERTQKIKQDISNNRFIIDNDLLEKSEHDAWEKFVDDYYDEIKKNVKEIAITERPRAQAIANKGDQLVSYFETELENLFRISYRQQKLLKKDRADYLKVQAKQFENIKKFCSTFSLAAQNKFYNVLAGFLRKKYDYIESRKVLNKTAFDLWVEYLKAAQSYDANVWLKSHSAFIACEELLEVYALYTKKMKQLYREGKYEIDGYFLEEDEKVEEDYEDLLIRMKEYINRFRIFLAKPFLHVPA